jgi:hypothetical protein
MKDQMRVIGTTGGALGLGAFAAAVAACCGPASIALDRLGGGAAGGGTRRGRVGSGACLRRRWMHLLRA